MATTKQLQCVKRLRAKYGDELLLQCAGKGKWVDHEFDFDNLSKDEAQRIITTAPHKPICGIYTPTGVVQSLCD